MKKIRKILLYTVITIILVVVIAVSYITLALPNVGAPEDIKVELTSQRIARGEYLANHVNMCMDCHSKRDWSKPVGAISASSLGGGGNVFDASEGFPGKVPVPNITPYKLKDWTDGEIFRAITTGERKDGSAIFPLMPWPYFSKMDREDVYSVIAYLRTLKPIKVDYARGVLDFPLNILVHTMPQKATLSKLPSPADTIKYGEYIVRSAACMQCHTQDKQGKPKAGLEFAGGHEFKIDGKPVYSANITPDKNTGIGSWSREAFVERFKSFTDSSKKLNPAAAKLVTVMPWYDYSGMTESDLKSVYAYLRTIKAIHNKVIN
ncbi:c-type cytochrome [Mucilaginibacter sp. BJC16-A38]|uniref:c-type cytochrome n=1 Tax=Mucilaginibacter phenanthrenivorans TaxID=1234842 RepID=UPI002157DA52|nr:c-type cytochrome [Mucilaginibacter phenanthrenivorans]MCR8559888.1 c-type cytochrome [Mucilaginibacter phenanthrenivorans]